MNILVIFPEPRLRISANSRSLPDRVRTGRHSRQPSSWCSRKPQLLFVSLFMQVHAGGPRCYPDCGVVRSCAAMEDITLAIYVIVTRQTSRTTSSGLQCADSR